jgi:hypothetical protein
MIDQHFQEILLEAMLHILKDSWMQKTNQPGYKRWAGRVGMNGYVVCELYKGAQVRKEVEGGPKPSPMFHWPNLSPW